jgi:hypothetical protein
MHPIKKAGCTPLPAVNAPHPIPAMHPTPPLSIKITVTSQKIGKTVKNGGFSAFIVLRFERVTHFVVYATQFWDGVLIKRLTFGMNSKYFPFEESESEQPV